MPIRSNVALKYPDISSDNSLATNICLATFSNHLVNFTCATPQSINITVTLTSILTQYLYYNFKESISV